MRQKYLILSAFLLILISNCIWAQTKFGIHGALILPTSSGLREISKLGVGAGVRMDFVLNKNVVSRIDASIYQSFEENIEIFGTPSTSTIRIIPLRVGLNYYLNSKFSTFYLSGMFGAYNRKIEIKSGQDSSPEERQGTSDTKMRFGLAPGLGIQIPINNNTLNLDIGIHYDIYFEDTQSNAFFNLSIGILFGFGNY
jgi:opacity protein-like surface antigen